MSETQNFINTQEEHLRQRLWESIKLLMRKWMWLSRGRHEREEVRKETRAQVAFEGHLKSGFEQSHDTDKNISGSQERVSNRGLAYTICFIV